MRKLFIMVAATVAGLTVAGLAIAARSGAGVYTLPASGSGWTNPVQGATTISANWANTTLADVASAITNSLDRAGTGEMDAPLKGYDGAVGGPGFTFNLEQNSGLYRIGSHDLGVSVNGVLAQEYSSAGGATTYGNSAVTGNLAVTGTGLVGGTLGVTGLTTLGTVAIGGATSLTAPLTVSGSGKITGLPTPSVASDAATKGYVDGGAGASTLTTCTVGYSAGWSDASAFTRCRKAVNGMVTLQIYAAYAGGGTATVGVVGAGARPNITIAPVGSDLTAYGADVFTINATGVITLKSTLNTYTYVFEAHYLAEN